MGNLTERQTLRFHRQHLNKLTILYIGADQMQVKEMCKSRSGFKNADLSAGVKAREDTTRELMLTVLDGLNCEWFGSF